MVSSHFLIGVECAIAQRIAPNANRVPTPHPAGYIAARLTRPTNRKRREVQSDPAFISARKPLIESPLPLKEGEGYQGVDKVRKTSDTVIPA